MEVTAYQRGNAVHRGGPGIQEQGGGRGGRQGWDGGGEVKADEDQSRRIPRPLRSDLSLIQSGESRLPGQKSPGAGAD